MTSDDLASFLSHYIAECMLCIAIPFPETHSVYLICFPIAAHAFSSVWNSLTSLGCQNLTCYPRFRSNAFCELVYPSVRINQLCVYQHDLVQLISMCYLLGVIVNY